MLPSAYSAEQAIEPTVYQLDEDPIAALRATLHACDLPMLDALSRRERKSDLGRAARALVLALRLELDAAAQLLESKGEDERPRGSPEIALALAP